LIIGCSQSHINLDWLIIRRGLGYGLLQLMLQLIPQLELSFSVIAFLFGPLPIAIFTSIVVMAGFILPSIWELLNTPPIRVIRQETRSKRSFAFMFLAGVLSLAVFSMALSENIQLSGLMLAAILLLSAILYGVVWSLLKFFKRSKISFRVYTDTCTYGLQITALALGLSLITVLTVLRTDLLQRWQQQLPEGTPNQFVYGLPPFDMPEFKQQIEKMAGIVRLISPIFEEG
jgi:putative ABC transport system permease protein